MRGWTAPETVLVGDRGLADRYRLEHPVTSPGGSAAWRAVDERLGRAVTVLFPSPDVASVEAVRRYSCLADDRLIRVLDLDGHRASLVLITEAYCGASLAELLSSGLLTAESAVELVAEASAAVAVVHAAGLAYGALTAESICWTDSGLVKLLDLALAPSQGEGAARDVEALQVILRSALTAELSPELLAMLSMKFDTADGLATALDPFRPADAPLRRSLVSPGPTGAPHRLARCSVRQLMATDVLTVSEDTPVLELAKLLANCHHTAVPVVDALGRVTGMISPADLAHWQLGFVSV